MESISERLCSCIIHSSVHSVVCFFSQYLQARLSAVLVRDAAGMVPAPHPPPPGALCSANSLGPTLVRAWKACSWVLFEHELPGGKGPGGKSICREVPGVNWLDQNRRSEMSHVRDTHQQKCKRQLKSRLELKEGLESASVALNVVSENGFETVEQHH